MRRGRCAAAPAILLCLWLAACGGTSRSARSASSHSTLATRSAVNAKHEPFGDYDRDDYVSGHGDADNDDSKLPKDGDNDSDNATGSYYDKDDQGVRYFGHAANPTDRRAVTALVKRYYVTAVAQDGSAGCALIASPLAKSVAETLGQAMGQPDLRGNTCATVMSKVYKLNHRQLLAYEPTLEVTGVRLEGGSGRAILGFKDLPGRQIGVTRESGVWKIQALIDTELP
jgi:hypothetical protein